jgi:uncharacterized protein involved in exopolysaccharide biosynthesis
VIVVATLEAIFRHPFRLVLLVILLPGLSVAVAFFLPRTYQASASLWALRRYVVIGATGPESDLQSTPAQTQATALAELLQSRTFDLAVASESGLASTLSAGNQQDPQLRDDALVQDLSTKVLVGASGNNLFVITYTNKSAAMAQQVVKSVIQNFEKQSEALSVQEAQLLLDSYQTQLDQAKQDEAAAAAAETKYLHDNPQLTPQDLQTDPQYVILHAQTQQAQSNVLNLENQIATLNQEISTQGNGTQSFFNVLDPPTLPARPVSRLKTLLAAGGLGLGLALLSVGVYLFILVRRDHAVYGQRELEQAASYPILMELPLLPEKTYALLVHETYEEESRNGRKLLLRN